MKGNVQTVLGLIEPAALGKTLTHEHLSMRFDVMYIEPDPKYAKYRDDLISLKTLGWIRQNQYSNHYNLILNDSDVIPHIEEELLKFKENGGGSIVENTTFGIQRNVEFLYKMSQKTGINIIAGTGFYVDAAQNEQTRQSKTEKIADLMMKEITEGCSSFPSAKCGIIGEIGCSWPLTAFEKCSIKAAGEVQTLTGAPVMFHPGRHHNTPEEILRVYQEAGGHVQKAVMGHLDRTLHTLSSLTEFAELGSFLEYDLFGIETSHYQGNLAVDMPSDAERIKRIKYLIDEGFKEKIVIAHDIHTKIRLEHFGGHGLSHIFVNIAPKMLDRGLSKSDIDLILMHNPANWLTF